jgi:hypothetical protein
MNLATEINVMTRDTSENTIFATAHL